MEQLKEGLVYIRDHHNIFWSLTYLAIVASLIGVYAIILIGNSVLDTATAGIKANYSF